MKTISILKKLITIYYYLLFIGLIAKLFRVVFQAISGNIRDLKLKVLGYELDYSNMSYVKITSTVVITIILYYVYFQAIYYLKDSLKDLDSGNYFSALVIRNFKKIGILFLVCSFGEIFGNIIFKLFFNSEFEFKLDTSIILFFIMGLFFMFLSEVFSKAKRLQQENELTI